VLAFKHFGSLPHEGLPERIAGRRPVQAHPFAPHPPSPAKGG
jgi:hypothetical protein